MQQMLFEFYNAIAVTELKGFFMMEASWLILNKLGQGNFTVEANLMRERFESRLSETKRSFKASLSTAERYMYRCGAVNFIEGQSFVQLRGDRYFSLKPVHADVAENK